METVGPPPVDDDLHLLHEWGDPFAPHRHQWAGAASILAHVAAVAILAILPADFLAGPPEPPPEPRRETRVTPLIAPPLTEFTQKEPAKGKVGHEIDVASLQPRVSRPPAPPPPVKRPVEIPAPAPKAGGGLLPEPPKIEASNLPPKLNLPPSNSDVPAPEIRTAEQPKLVLENVGSPPPPVPPGQSKVPIPSGSVQDAIRQNMRGGQPGGTGTVVGSSSAEPQFELKSDAMGVDFRPYLSQILVTIKRNWLAVYPESARLGLRGKVALAFIIARNGSVSRVTKPVASGAESLDRAAIAAISASTPFPPLPAEFKGNQIVLQLNFAYNMPKQ